MAISRSHDKKSPSQNPTSFYKGEQQGGAYGKATSVPDKLTGGPMREKVYGGGGAGSTNKSK
jgi:hypothetical protein